MVHSEFQLGAYMVNLVEHFAASQTRAIVELCRAISKKQDKDNAFGLLKKTKDEMEAVKAELEREKEMKTKVQEEVSKLNEDLHTEKGISESLQTEVDSMKSLLSIKEVELVKVAETLKQTDKEANILYGDCVAKFKESEDFATELEIKAGVFHEEGYNDCLKFVGAGNTVNLAVHSIDKFRDIEVAKYEAERAEAEAEEKARMDNAGGARCREREIY